MFPFLALEFLVSFLSYLRGAPKIDLPLFMFSLANTFFTSFFLDSTLLVWETKTIVLVKEISWEEKSYPKPVQSKANFWKLIILSSFALEVLSSWTLTWNNSTSSFLVFSAKKLFSISVFQWSDRLHQTSWIFLLVQAPLHWVSWWPTYTTYVFPRPCIILHRLCGCHLFIHLLKFWLHQILFFIHIFNNPLSRIYSGSEGI